VPSAHESAVRVEGLREFRASLKALGDGSEKKLRSTLNDAGEIVVDHTKPWVPSVTGRARGSLKLASTQANARVKMGGSKAPYVPWLDFGGTNGRGVQRRFFSEGRYLWRTLGKQHDAIAEALNTSLIGLIKESGLEVTH
jgi:hypothetical protein